MSTALADTSLAVAVDIGGTFTDIALYDAKSGQIWRAKTPSVPADPSQAFLAGVRLALEDAGRAAMTLGRVLHGTTVATNMILEDKGARTALVTTRGFRHVLAIGRQDIPRRANYLAWVKPPRPVPASRVFEVSERIGAGGTIVESLDEASVQAAAEACRGQKVEAVAVCLLHSFANPVHERRVADLLRAALPGIAVTASSDVLPVVREYERSLATVLNALVMPGVATYVSRLEDRLAEEKVEAPLLYMQSNGGVAGGATIRRAPLPRGQARGAARRCCRWRAPRPQHRAPCARPATSPADGPARHGRPSPSLPCRRGRRQPGRDRRRHSAGLRSACRRRPWRSSRHPRQWSPCRPWARAGAIRRHGRAA